MSDAGSHLWALFVFAFAAFSLVALARRVLARRLDPPRAHRRGLSARARHRGRAQPPPLRRLHRPRRDRAHPDRDRRLLELPDQPRPAAPGRAVRQGRRLRHHLPQAHGRPAERADRLRRPARRRRGTASTSPTLDPARNYYPTQDPTAGAIGRYFMGESTSEVGLKTGAGGDLWTAFQPDLSSLNPAIVRGNRQLGGPAAEGPGDRDHRARPALRPGSAAGQLPRDRQPAGRLDLDRRPDRARRGGDGGLAGARVAPPRLEAAYRARLGQELGTSSPPA